MATLNALNLTVWEANHAVLMGAGALGRKSAKGLRASGFEPVAFCDNNPALWGQTIEGLCVLSPAAAASKFAADHLFLICIWHPSKIGMKQRVKQLEDLGCRYIAAFAQVFLKYPEVFLPHGLFEDPSTLEEDNGRIEAAMRLFEGVDREEFKSQLRLRLQGDFAGLKDPVPGMQYFPDDLIQLGESEYFVDCGAYNGDTLDEFLTLSEERFHRYVACEPDPINFAALKSKVSESRITALPFAVGRTQSVVPFFASGTESSAVQSGAASFADCVSLDELLNGEHPTYIKMDIEGFEPDALLGARDTIRRCRPKLAVCVYHRGRHLWELPLLMKELQPQSRLYLRPHLADGWDLVCYSIPE